MLTRSHRYGAFFYAGLELSKQTQFGKPLWPINKSTSINLAIQKIYFGSFGAAFALGSRMAQRKWIGAQWRSPA